MFLNVLDGVEKQRRALADILQPGKGLVIASSMMKKSILIGSPEFFCWDGPFTHRFAGG